MGIGIDLYGIRRTVLAVFPLAIAGSVVSALAPGFGVLVAGQMLIGIGCAPAFLVCTVFVARRFEAGRFAAVSGLAMGIGALGLLLTGTPLAWLVEATSWRGGFWTLGGCSALAWLAIAGLVREPPAPSAATARPSVREALQSYGALFALPRTLGILALSAVTYASFISLRGLWLGPLLMQRHGFSLVHSGHAALAMSVVGIVSPALFGRLDPGETRRRHWIVGFTGLMAALFVSMAWGLGAAFDVAGALGIGLLSGYCVLQYADVRAAYPSDMTGRAMALFTMAMFLGVAVMQWITGAIASAAQSHGIDPYRAVPGAIAALLVAGALAFALMPAPQRLPAQG